MPSVIVLAVERDADGATVVTVLPITHSVPVDPDSAVEIPMPVKRHVGLDDDPSWIIENRPAPYRAARMNRCSVEIADKIGGLWP